MLHAGENQRFLPGVSFHEPWPSAADAAAALASGELVLLVVPAQTMRQNAAALRPHLRPGRPCWSAAPRGWSSTSGGACRKCCRRSWRRAPRAASPRFPAQPLRRGRARAADRHGRGRARRTRGPGGAGALAPAPPARLHQPRPHRRGAGRRAQERDRPRRGHLRRAGLRRQRQGGVSHPGSGRNGAAGRGDGGQPAYFRRPGGRGRPRGHLRQPSQPQPPLRRAAGARRALAEIQARMVQVAEGVPTTAAAMGLASRYGVELPITEHMHAVLFAGASPRAAVTELMTRDPKDELAGMIDTGSGRTEHEPSRLVAAMAEGERPDLETGQPRSDRRARSYHRQPGARARK